MCAKLSPTTTAQLVFVLFPIANHGSGRSVQCGPTFESENGDFPLRHAGQVSKHHPILPGDCSRFAATAQGWQVPRHAGHCHRAVPQRAGPHGARAGAVGLPRPVPRGEDPVLHDHLRGGPATDRRKGGLRRAVRRRDPRVCAEHGPGAS
uniref:Uncharacterized protein n=1 Tax=Ixodes ricinus TaxID=34613 RepID=A0A6B0UVV4_IXORI